jgi:CHAT domain-containing protein
MKRLTVLLMGCLCACRSVPVRSPAVAPQAADLAAADRLDREAVVLFDRGELLPAIDKLSAALTLWRRAANEAAEANVTAMLASLYVKVGNPEQALAFGARARDLYHRQGARLSEGVVLGVMGNLQAAQGSAQTAYETLSAAAALLEGGDARQRAGVFLARGMVAAQLERDEEALADFARAAELFHQLGDWRNEATCLSGAAEVHRERLALEKSLASYQAALALYDQVGEKHQAALTLRAIGLTAMNLDQPLAALASFRRELALWEALGDVLQQAQAFGDLGLLQTSLAEFKEALRSFTRAGELAAEAHDQGVEAQVLLQAASADEELDDLPQALVLAQKALEIFRSRHDRKGEAQALTDIGNYEMRQVTFQRTPSVVKLPASAAESLEAALQIWRDLGDDKGEARVLTRLGDAYLLAGEREKLARLLGRARDLAVKMNQRSDSNRIELISWALLTETNAGQTRDALTEALAVDQARGDTVAEARVLSGLGYCSEIGKDLPRALALYQRSIDLQETLEARQALDFLETAVGAGAANAYERAVLVSLRLGRTAQAFEIAERSRARPLVAELARRRVQGESAESKERVIRREREVRAALAELEGPGPDRPSDAHPAERLAARRAEYDELLAQLSAADRQSVAAPPPRPVTLVEVQRRLDVRTALLSYFVTAERTLAFVVTRGAIQAIDLPVTRDDLEQAVGALRSDPAAYEQLSRWLIAPVAGHLRAPVVGIVPHAMLHYVPFAALRDGKRYFGESHALFRLPRAALLPAGPRRLGSAARLKPLVVAYSPSGNEPGQLAQVRDEAESIARLFGIDPLFGAKATPAEFLARLRGHPRIVHVAAHAELVRENPFASWIRLAPGSGKEDGSLYLHQVYGLGLPGTELVVLSACQTAAGGVSPGDDIVALDRGFLHAGVAAVLASLWDVHDAVATRVLMEAFYRQLKKGASKAAALQAAQAETRRRFPLPGDWAGFVLTGDPGPIVDRGARRDRGPRTDRESGSQGPPAAQPRSNSSGKLARSAAKTSGQSHSDVALDEGVRHRAAGHGDRRRAEAVRRRSQRQPDRAQGGAAQRERALPVETEPRRSPALPADTYWCSASAAVAAGSASRAHSAYMAADGCRPSAASREPSPSARCETGVIST